MTGHIPDSFIEELLSRVDIVDVIGTRVPLRRAGHNFMARCPFHSEKTPSFSVSPNKQIYHCFGCGKNGNALTFLTEYEGLHFVDAIEALANKIGVTVPFEGNQPLENFSSIYAVLEEAKEFYKSQLKHPEKGKKAIHYLKSRGLTGQIAKQFSLGYAPPGWDNLLKAKGTSQEQLENLLKAGLIIQKEGGGYYDRFRDRVLFPILNRRGQVVGFGGRIIDVGEPKYLNSPESKVFNKGQELYGLHEAKKGRHLQTLIVVEGYMDVVSLVAAGIHDVVATLGTALTDKHIQALFKEVSEVVFCFDSDTAGKKAAERAFKLCLPHMKEGRRVRFAIMPAPEDPDSYIRKHGREAFLAEIERAKSMSDYLFEYSSQDLSLSQIEGRALFVNRANALIALLPKGVYQQMMLEKLAELSGMDSYKPFTKKPFSNKFENSNKKPAQKPRLPAPPAIRAVAMLLENRTLLSYIPRPHDFLLVESPGTELLCAIIEILRSRPDMLAEEIGSYLPSHCLKYFVLARLKEIAASIPPSGLVKEFEGAILRLEERAKEKALEDLLKKAKENILSPSEKGRLKSLLDLKDKNRVD